jgi:carboxymethylenebutenolidase
MPPSPIQLTLMTVTRPRILFGNSGAIGEIELHSGVHHGFAFSQRWCYDKHAAERPISLYRRRLG